MNTIPAIPHDNLHNVLLRLLRVLEYHHHPCAACLFEDEWVIIAESPFSEWLRQISDAPVYTVSEAKERMQELSTIVPDILTVDPDEFVGEIEDRAKQRSILLDRPVGFMFNDALIVVSDVTVNYALYYSKHCEQCAAIYAYSAEHLKSKIKSAVDALRLEAPKR